jgi:cell division protein FtsQ
MGGSMTQFKQTIWRSFFALGVIIAVLFASSWFFFPVDKVLVSGTKNLEAQVVAQMAGVSRGNPWLWVSKARAMALEREPWVKQAKLVKTFPGTVTIQLVERVPLAVWKRLGKSDVIAEDGVILPTGKALLVLEGDGEEQFEQALLVARTAKQMGAIRVKFDSNGFLMVLPNAEIWVQTHKSLLKYGESVRMMVMQPQSAMVKQPQSARLKQSQTKRVNVYSWGVSVQ